MNKLKMKNTNLAATAVAAHPRIIAGTAAAVHATGAILSTKMNDCILVVVNSMY